MLEIEIDGKAVTVENGSTVMDAANKAGVYIPHFCYHKKLSIAANCRMCLVQVEKAPKPLPACATPATPGMKVWTRSEQAIKAQKGVMEFLLINHPLDCPICDQGGECQLQDLAVGYGSGQSRYQEEKRVVFNKNLGPLVSTDMTRCINCTRCVRFTDEIAGRMELGQAFRGEHAEIMPFIEKTVDSELSGNIIDLCPVGALTSKPFRFSARTWELARRKSISPHDSLGSNLIVQVKHDAVLRVLPMENEDINECWLSDKDRFSYEGLNSDERLLKPMIKADGEWREVDWQEALEFAANGLRAVIAEHGAQSLGFLGSPHSTVEELYLLQKLAKGLDCSNIDHRLRQSDFRADALRSGAPWLGMPISEVTELDHLLVIGSFLRKDTPLLAQRVRRAARQGLAVSVINPVDDDWLLPIRNKLTRAPSRFVETLCELIFAVAEVKGLAPDASLALEAPGSISDDCQSLAQALVSADNAAIWLGNFAVQDSRSADLQLLAQELARLSGARLGFIGEAANSVGGYLAGAVPAQGGLDVAHMIAQPRKAYVLLNAEPDRDFADTHAAQHAVASARFVVALSSFGSVGLAEAADVLLPVAPFTETSGTFVNCEGRVQSFVAVAPPLADTRPAWKVLRVLGNLLAVAGFDYSDSETVRLAALGGDVSSRFNNVLKTRPVLNVVPASGLERIADVPIHFADPLVRRAWSLQRSRDAVTPVAHVHGDTLSANDIPTGARVRLCQGSARIEIEVVVDDCVAPNCVRIASGHDVTAGLGAMSGPISMERV